MAGRAATETFPRKLARSFVGHESPLMSTRWRDLLLNRNDQYRSVFRHSHTFDYRIQHSMVSNIKGGLGKLDTISEMIKALDDA